MTRTLVCLVLFSGLSACQCGGVQTASDGGGGSGGATGDGGQVAGGSGGSGGTGGALGGGSGGTGGTGGATGGSGGSGSLDGGLMDFCASNAPVPVQIGSNNLCTGDLGKRVFTFAFCACTDVTASNQFRVGTIAGARDGGGSVGFNGNFVSSNVTTIGGTLWTGGSVTSNNTLNVGRDIAAASVSASHGTVGRDIRSEGNVTANNTFTVGGRVIAPTSATVNGVTAAGGIVRQAVTVPDPCDCTQPADVPGIVRFFQSVADNTARNVSTSALMGGNAPVSLTLECGRYYFSGVSSSSSISIRTRGRVVIAIEGNVNVSNNFSLIPEAGSQIDLFVAGNLTFSNMVTLGDNARPAATRVYVGGTSVSTSNQLSVAANIYAPRAAFNASNRVDIRGALFVNSVSSSNNFSIDYDDAILNLDGCASADAGCTSSRECANPTPACGTSGRCVACVTDADCTAPLNCDPVQGTCYEGLQ